MAIPVQSFAAHQSIRTETLMATCDKECIELVCMDTVQVNKHKIEKRIKYPQQNFDKYNT